MTKTLPSLFITVICPILLGLFIYLVFGSKDILLFHYIPLPDFLASFREGKSAPDWFIYNLPDGLWLYSLVQAMAKIWKGHKGSIIAQTACIGLAVGHEVLQKFGYILGTFDLLDILAYCLLGGLAIAFIKIGGEYTKTSKKALKESYNNPQ